MEPCVLLLSHSQEPFCTERVAGALAARGVRPLRLDTDSFPTALALSGALECGHAGTLIWDGEPAPAVVQAVWLWRLWPGRMDPRLEPHHAEAGQREAAAALRGLLELLDQAMWLDPIDASHAAGNKLRQLRLAQRAGLTIPPTLITSDPVAARVFYHRHGGRVIAKLQTTLGYGMQVVEGLPTRLLGPADLDALDGLRHCPMVLQRYIEKAHELRIAWVDGQAFVGALDGSQCGVDWRYECTASWQGFALPDAVHARLRQLMQDLGLRQGAVDMIVTPQGEYVFLEVNPSGEWGMLELDLGLPISQALATALTRYCQKS